MKKIIPLFVLLVLLFCACTRANSPALKTSFSQNAVVESGDFSYNAEIKFDNNTVYITPTSSNAAGLTVSSDGQNVNFSFRDMSDSCEYSSVSDYNTAKILYCVFCNTYNAQVKRAGDNTLFLGKTDVGNYETLVKRCKGVLIKLKKEKGPLGLSFFAFNYPTPWRGWGE